MTRSCFVSFHWCRCTIRGADAPYGWRLMLGIAAVPGALMGLSACVLPESPRWLVMQGNLEAALAILHDILRSKRPVKRPQRATELASVAALGPGQDSSRHTTAAGSASGSLHPVHGVTESQQLPHPIPPGQDDPVAVAEHELLLLWSAVEKEHHAAAEWRSSSPYVQSDSLVGASQMRGIIQSGDQHPNTSSGTSPGELSADQRCLPAHEDLSHSRHDASPTPTRDTFDIQLHPQPSKSRDLHHPQLDDEHPSNEQPQVHNEHQPNKHQYNEPRGLLHAQALNERQYNEQRGLLQPQNHGLAGALRASL